MDEFTYTAEQIKEMIISDYLKRHPQIKREEIVTNLVNGRFVIGTVEVIFRDLSQKKGKPKELFEERKEQIDELSRGGDERCTLSLTSIQSSKKYVDWLFQSRFTGFLEKDREDNFLYLSKQETICSERAVEINEIKQQFTDAMQENKKPTHSQIQGYVYAYMKAVHAQLKSQALIYKREVDLGNRFVTCSQALIQNHFTNIRAGANPSAVRALSKAIITLRDNQVMTPEVKTDQDLRSFNNALTELGAKLEKRREEYENLHEIVTFLESYIEQLKPPEDTSPLGPTSRTFVTTKNSL